MNSDELIYNLQRINNQFMVEAKVWGEERSGPFLLEASIIQAAIDYIREHEAQKNAPAH